MKKFWIVKAGTTFPDTARRHGDFDQWTRNAMGVGPGDVAVLDVDDDRPLPDPSSCGGVVVTGSHAMVTDALPWSVQLESWIPRLLEKEVPLLGICYGHQLLAKALGGRVGYHGAGREIGTVEVELLPACGGDPLFSGLPQTILAHAAHAQTVIALPPGAERLARNDFEPNHAFRMGPSAWGVQFHPEYDAAIMCSYIEQLSDELEKSQRDVSTLIESVQETREARAVLRRFASVAVQKD